MARQNKDTFLLRHDFFPQIKMLAMEQRGRLFHDEKETILSLSPSLANKLIGSASSELNALEKWLDRINAACKHQCDNLRTMISFEKERMRL